MDVFQATTTTATTASQDNIIPIAIIGALTGGFTLLAGSVVYWKFGRKSKPAEKEQDVFRFDESAGRFGQPQEREIQADVDAFN